MHRPAVRARAMVYPSGLRLTRVLSRTRTQAAPLVGVPLPGNSRAVGAAGALLSLLVSPSPSGSYMSGSPAAARAAGVFNLRSVVS